MHSPLMRWSHFGEVQTRAKLLLFNFPYKQLIIFGIPGLVVKEGDS